MSKFWVGWTARNGEIKEDDLTFKSRCSKEFQVLVHLYEMW